MGLCTERRRHQCGGCWHGAQAGACGRPASSDLVACHRTRRTAGGHSPKSRMAAPWTALTFALAARWRRCGGGRKTQVQGGSQRGGGACLAYNHVPQTLLQPGRGGAVVYRGRARSSTAVSLSLALLRAAAAPVSGIALPWGAARLRAGCLRIPRRVWVRQRLRLFAPPAGA